MSDVNDNAPKFERESVRGRVRGNRPSLGLNNIENTAGYVRTVEEGATSFDPPLIVKATDIDGPTQVWPLTQFFMFVFVKETLICLEGNSMTPRG